MYGVCQKGTLSSIFSHTVANYYLRNTTLLTKTKRR